jgi:hypothetical protein
MVHREVLSGVFNNFRDQDKEILMSTISLPSIQAQTLNLEPERAALREQGKEQKQI